MFPPYPDRNLILTGYTGPDRPMVGQGVAEALKMRYISIDSQIEMRMGMDSDEVRSRYGEVRLKMIEAEVMSDVLLYRGAVIRVGGQTLIRGETIKSVQENGMVICLVVTLGAVLRRLHQALGGRYHNPQERALAVGQLKREWGVRKHPGVHELDVTDFTEPEIIQAIMTVWQKASVNEA